MASNDSVKRGARDAESESVLVSARHALDEYRDFRYGNTKLESKFYELGLLTKNQRVAAVDIALAEIKPSHRCGPNPPGNISKGGYPGRPLYAFRWLSKEYGRMMYLKFCLSGITGVELLVLHSFHQNRP
jgi:hypothetical protein